MENIKEILDSVKERVVNPFFISFLIAWIFFNWETSVALIWYDKTQLDNKTIFEFIRCNSGWWKSFWGPILSSVIYTTYLMPILKNIKLVTNTYIDKVGAERNFRIAATTPVNFNKYMALLKELEREKNELAASINEKEESDAKTVELENEIRSLKSTLEQTIRDHQKAYSALQDEAGKHEEELAKELEDQKKQVAELFDFSFLTGGIWRITYRDSNKQPEALIFMDENNITRTDGEAQTTWKMLLYVCLENRIFIILESKRVNKIQSVFILSKNPDESFSGTENSIPVIFEKGN